MKKYLFILLILLVPYFCFAEDTRCTWESNDKKFKIIVDTNDFIPNVSYDNHTIGMINSSVNNLEDNACKMQDVYYACGNYNIEGVKQDSYVCYVSYIEEDISSSSEDDELGYWEYEEGILELTYDDEPVDTYIRELSEGNYVMMSYDEDGCYLMADSDAAVTKSLCDDYIYWYLDDNSVEYLTITETEFQYSAMTKNPYVDIETYEFEEYEFNGNRGFYSEPFKLITVKNAQDQKFRKPADKLLSNSAPTPNAEGFVPIPDSIEEEIPF